jgi:hypothetical protein
VREVSSSTPPALSVTICGMPVMNAGAPPSAIVSARVVTITWVPACCAVIASSLGLPLPAVTPNDAT